jgi:hypothetical protein
MYCFKTVDILAFLWNYKTRIIKEKPAESLTKMT